MHLATYAASLQASINLRLLQHHLSHVFAYCCSLTIFFYILRGFFKGPRQKLIAGIHVVGGNDVKSIQLNRERFRTQAKEMLLEGYKEVQVIPNSPIRRTAS